MNFLIAMMFISFETTPPKYNINKCYQADTDYRPSTIKILRKTKKKYVYKIWYGWQKTWSGPVINDSMTIEQIYDKEVKCPE